MFAESQIYAGRQCKNYQNHKRQYKKSISCDREVYSPTYNQRQRRKIELENEIGNLTQQIQMREHEIVDIKDSLNEYYKYQSQRRVLERKQAELESQLEDLELFHQKIKKQSRLAEQEQQIVKGKAIVLHNKITEIKQEHKVQLQRRQVLEKHLDQVSKGAQILKKRINHLKGELKKKKNGMPLFTQSDLKDELNKMESELEVKENNLGKLLKKEQKFVSAHQYHKLKQTFDELEKESQIQKSLILQNQKLLKQKNELTERIAFLEHFDSESINQKKSLIEQLVQNYHILEKQKQNSNRQLEIYQQQLSQLQHQHHDGMRMLKKQSRRKKEPKGKQKHNVKEQEVKVEEYVKFEQKSVNRWKGKLLKKKCFLAMIILLVGSLIMGSMTAFR